MFGELIDLFRENPEIFKSKLVLYVIIGVFAIVILNLLLDRVRKYIRGLDTAAIGALVFWLGYKLSQVPMVPKGVAEIVVLTGAVFFLIGLLVFIFKVVFKRKRKRKAEVRETGKHDVQDEPEEEKGE